LKQAEAARSHAAAAEALLILSDERALLASTSPYGTGIHEAVATARARIEAAGIDWRSAAIEARYARVSEIHRAVTTEIHPHQETFSDRLDRILTHNAW